MFLIRWAIAALIVCTLLPWSWALLTQTWTRSGFIPLNGLAVLIGAFFSLLAIFLKRPNGFIHTFIHEAAHAVVCLMLLVRVRDFQVSNGKGGYVIHDSTGPIRGTIISLAPYTLPMVLIPLFIAFYVFTSEGNQMLLSGLISFAYFHHLHGLFHNIRLNFWGKQADLTKAGRILSLSCISTCLLLVTAWTLKVLT